MLVDLAHPRARRTPPAAPSGGATRAVGGTLGIGATAQVCAGWIAGAHDVAVAFRAALFSDLRPRARQEHHAGDLVLGAIHVTAGRAVRAAIRSAARRCDG